MSKEINRNSKRTEIMNTQTNIRATERIGYRGKTYLIDIPMRDLVETPHQDNKWQREQIEYAIERQDWVTVENRINNGLRFMWLFELDENGVRVE
jgi:hypothetical protein